MLIWTKLLNNYTNFHSKLKKNMSRQKIQLIFGNKEYIKNKIKTLSKNKIKKNKTKIKNKVKTNKIQELISQGILLENFQF